MNDAELVAQYLEEYSEEAFRTLVERHSPMVYAACLRGLDGNIALAEDAVQAVFIVLARKIKELKGRTELGPWLFWTANLVVKNARREEIRRKRRETAAAAKREKEHTMRETYSPWDEARSYLNDAIGALGSRQQEVVILHFFQGYSQAEVARVLGCSDSAVRRRLASGMEKIRRFLAKKGVLFAAAPLAVFLKTEAVVACPAGFTATCSAAALTAAKGTLAGSCGTAFMAKGAIKMMVWLKVKAVAYVVVAALAVGGVMIQTVSSKKAHQTKVTSSSRKKSANQKSIASKRELDALLKQKINYSFRRDTLGEMLLMLNAQTGLKSAFPKCIDRQFLFSFEARDVPVRTILEKAAKQGGFSIEYRGNTVIFWKKAELTTIKHLLVKLKDPNAQTRSEAVYELGQIGDKRIYSYLANALRDKAPRVQRWACTMLLKNHRDMLSYANPQAEIQNKLHKFLNNPPAGISAEDLAGVLADLGDDAAINVLLLQLKDKKKQLSAISHLSHVNNPKVTDALIALLKKQNPATKDYHTWSLVQRLAPALACIGDQRAVGPLLEYARKNIMAAMAVAKLDPTRAVKAFVPLLKNTEWKVRQSAAFGLGWVQDQSVVKPLLQMLKDENQRVRITALCALLKRGEKQAFSETIRMLRSGKIPLQSQALAILCMQGKINKFRNSAGDTMVIDFLRKANSALLSRAQRALNRIRPPGLAKIIISKLQNETDTLKSHELHALKNLLIDTRDLETLRPYLRKGPYSVREAAVKVLADFGTPEDAKLITAILDDPKLNIEKLSDNPRAAYKDPRLKLYQAVLAAVSTENTAELLAEKYQQVNNAYIETKAWKLLFALKTPYAEVVQQRIYRMSLTADSYLKRKQTTRCFPPELDKKTVDMMIAFLKDPTRDMTDFGKLAYTGRPFSRQEATKRLLSRAVPRWMRLLKSGRFNTAGTIQKKLVQTLEKAANRTGKSLPDLERQSHQKADNDEVF